MENPFRGAAAALFDLDGTLIRTHIDFPQMKREMLALVERAGIDPAPLEPIDILTVVEEARRSLVSRGEPEKASRLRAEAFARLEEIEVEQCARPEPVEGASELLSRLQLLGIRIGIVTRNCRTVSRRLTSEFDLACDALFTRDDVPLTKPDPGHLLTALAALGVKSRMAETPTLPHPHAPTHPHTHTPTPPPCVMVGDHWMDVRAGHAAGLRTIGILLDRPADFFAPSAPDLLVYTLADLIPLAASINGTEPSTLR